MARAIRAARSVSRSRVWLVPENTSMSPDFALRTCTTMGPPPAIAGAPVLAAEPPVLAAEAPVLAEARELADAAGLRAPPNAVAASPAAPAVAAPRMTERRETPSAGEDCVS
jgi:hypothetical protein